MLRLGGYINMLIAVGHLIGLIWAEQMFEVTGIGEEINVLAQSHSSLPYILTVLVSIVFFIFGLYGLSADGEIKKLPFLKIGIFTIAGIYIFRGLGETIVRSIEGTNSSTELTYSTIAFAIGFLFFAGGLKKWKLKKE